MNRHQSLYTNIYLHLCEHNKMAYLLTTHNLSSDSGDVCMAQNVDDFWCSHVHDTCQNLKMPHPLDAIPLLCSIIQLSCLLNHKRYRNNHFNILLERSSGLSLHGEMNQFSCYKPPSVNALLLFSGQMVIFSTEILIIIILKFC